MHPRSPTVTLAGRSGPGTKRSLGTHVELVLHFCGHDFGNLPNFVEHIPYKDAAIEPNLLDIKAFVKCDYLESRLQAWRQALLNPQTSHLGQEVVLIIEAGSVFGALARFFSFCVSFASLAQEK
jgi:hypothetical protein